MELWKISNGNDFLIVAISVSNLKPYVCGNLDNCIVSLHVQDFWSTVLCTHIRVGCTCNAHRWDSHVCECEAWCFGSIEKSSLCIADLGCIRRICLTFWKDGELFVVMHDKSYGYACQFSDESAPDIELLFAISGCICVFGFANLLHSWMRRGYISLLI